VKILVNFCISEVDKIGVRVCKKSCAARPWEVWKHTVSKFRTVSMNITVKDTKRCNIAEKCERLNILFNGGELIRRKTFDSTLFSRDV